MLAHPTVIRPEDHAVFTPGGMGKSTLFSSPRLLVGVNAFEPGQAHALHAHRAWKGLPRARGRGLFLLEGAELPMRAGDMLVAPEGVPHGVRCTGSGGWVLAVLAGPGAADTRSR